MAGTQVDLRVCEECGRARNPLCAVADARSAPRYLTIAPAG